MRKGLPEENRDIRWHKRHKKKLLKRKINRNKIKVVAYTYKPSNMKGGDDMIISRPLRLVKQDLLNISKGALVAAGGAVLAFIAEQVLPNLDSGDYVWLVPVLSVIVNALRKFFLEQVYYEQ